MRLAAIFAAMLAAAPAQAAVVVMDLEVTITQCEDGGNAGCDYFPLGSYAATISIDLATGRVTLLPDPGPGGKVDADLEGRDDEADEATVYAGVQGAGGCPARGAGSDAFGRCGRAGRDADAAEDRLELEAAGSASAIERQQAEAAELAQLRRDNRRLKEEVEVLRKASAFFAQWAATT
jgi:hypothetical protein